MKRTDHKLFWVIAAMFIFASAAVAQNRFEGYSFTLAAGSDGACPMRYLPPNGDQNGVDVYLAGTNQQTPATGITACGGSRAQGNRVSPNTSGQWCFQGGEKMYDVKLRNGTTYLWYSLDQNSGRYNVKDFRPVRRVGSNPATYEFSEPADYSATIKNAMAFIAARQGGTLFFPDGDYIVGTTNGNTRDARYDAITVPSGIVIEGSSPNYSIAGTNLPIKTSASRIRLRNEDQTIFRIGGCTNNVVIRNIELLGNTALYGEQRRNNRGNYGIEGLGQWSLNPYAPNSSQVFRFENISFQNFDRAIFVHNTNDANCKSTVQSCFAWQFDYVKVDHGVFINNNNGIWVDTYNSDWKITNSFFGYSAQNAPGDGIRIQKAGTMLIEQTFGGGYDYASNIGGTFIYIDTIGSLTIINSSSERGKRSLYMNPLGATSNLMINTIGSHFADKIELNGRINYVSTGNLYAANTFQADPSVLVTSTGDRFCWDQLLLPGTCKNEAGIHESQPGFGNARVMFRTGRLGEVRGANTINRQPNLFGYDVEIKDGLMQYDPDTTFADITHYASETEGGQRVKDGAIVYCKDCRRDASGLCSQGRAGTDGAFAKRINNRWRCD